jgi:hypothetical protein
MDNEVKYYELFLTGEVKRDANKLPVKDDKGKVIVSFTRDTTPSAALMALGLTSNKWFWCEAVEVNIGKDSMASASGKVWDIGPVVKKGTTVNIFYNTQKEIYKAIIDRFLSSKFTWVNDPNAEKWDGGDPIIHLSNWALPGRVVEYETGFKYTLHTRNKVTKVMEPVISHPYDDKGNIIDKPVVKTTGSLFLFASELSAMEAHVKDAIDALKQYKIAEPIVAERKEETLTAQAPVTTPTAPVAEKLTI